MQRISEIPQASFERIEGLLFDLDDTVLDHGRLALPTYAALCRLAAREVRLVGVTGRPASWGQVLIRQWPVDGMITENGSITLHREHGRIVVSDRCTPQQRKERRTRLHQLADQLMARFPSLVPTDDSFGRLADFTFDIGENQNLEPDEIQRVSTAARELGLRTVHSSVHLHISLDVDDKASGSLRFLSRVFQIEPGLARSRWAFIGDSGNDAACFAAFETTIGVANLRGPFSLPPRYMTRGNAGEGFVEATEQLFPA